MTGNNEVSVVKRVNTLPAVQPGAQEIFVNPSTDVYETPDAFVLMIDLPGVAKDAINVTMENGTLNVRAKIEPHHSPHARLLFKELRGTTYYRVFNLGDGIDRTNVDAHYELGTLTIKLFKKEETKPREIQIN